MSEVAVLVPTLGRASVLQQLVENFDAVTPAGGAHLVFVADSQDGATQRVLGELGVEVVICDGTYPVKINAGYRATVGEPFILPTADDVRFRFDWLEQALDAFRPGIEVVGTNDLTPATADKRHATMPIVRRAYVEDPGAVWGEPGLIFHEGYHHSFVETELWQLAVHRGVVAFASDSVIEHLHPAWGTREVDDTDRKGNQVGWKADKALFRERRAAWTASS